ncbi:isoprenylcysteine carboxylmethyltransferase family protein [Aestuariirhabdus sp. Z084]|uniref:methyltransferase family protein n=1 Tax=Aestuariirhabdus haliotis TaxID=2918751 RepID=UPI00201B372D|nr:isoprenylcysteine carboxylmethyltransferase family protein [Aestuariirhabdus haliotis]MCL6415008.1 isoprenylcysteine carboxylmethyltransferase family protein [Aestuariirhabdus haliotis]MCL6418940.1 isoprenylcysteine carboxylmethyltransferase family protein [Aestuariirhabdus haliotis]
MTRFEMKIPPPIYLLLFAALMWWLADSFSVWRWQHPLSLIAGWVLIGAGLALDVGGLIRFVRAKTTINPHRPQHSTTLVVEGVYRLTRNPMYLGMLLLLCGWGLVLGSGLALILPPLFAYWMTRVQIMPEERALLSRFGEPYQQYLDKVRRWI